LIIGSPLLARANAAVELELGLKVIVAHDPTEVRIKLFAFYIEIPVRISLSKLESRVVSFSYDFPNLKVLFTIELVLRGSILYSLAMRVPVVLTLYFLGVTFMKKLTGNFFGRDVKLQIFHTQSSV
jgi:hypothetical protein